MKRLKTVSLCMIVKNEEKYLAQCLSSVKDIVDEIIIVDTGSTDQTIMIAESFGAKIFHYQWTNDFSKARNFSLSKASCDWILLLDGDEVLDSKSKDLFIQFINESPLDGCHFKLYNYIDSDMMNHYGIHFAFRLLRNNGNYHFVGAIHEQITPIEPMDCTSRFSSEDIIVHHYGYLNSQIKEKNKRSRNLPIILKQLESNPHEPFYLFNLANEYMALGKFKDALVYYGRALEYITDFPVFLSHIFYRMINCAYKLKDYKEAVKLADEALTVYPLCTDYEYLKGLIYTDWHKYPLAITAFNKCLDMGPSPSSLSFLNDCGTYRPYISLGNIYMSLEDFKQALYYFTKAINVESSLCNLLYQVGHALKLVYEDEKDITNFLSAYFSDLNYAPNLILYTDILLREQLLESSKEALKRLNPLDGYFSDKLLLTGKYYFYTQQYDLAFENFMSLVQLEKVETIIAQAKAESLKFLMVIAFIHQPDSLKTLLEYFTQIDEPNLEKIYQDFYKLYSHIPEKVLITEEDAELYLPLITDFLDKLLKVHAFDLFEQFLSILNHVDSKDVLLHLAKLYYSNGLKQMAIKTIYQSLKEFETIDGTSLDILFS